MPGEFGDITAGIAKFRLYPANYLAMIGLNATDTGKMKRVRLPVVGGTAASLDLGLFGPKAGGGTPEPGLLLATGSAVGIPASVAGLTYGADAGGEGSETAVLTPPVLVIFKAVSSKVIPASAAFSYRALDTAFSVIGEGTLEVSFHSHRGEEPADPSRNFFFLTGAPLGPALNPVVGDEQLEGEPFDGKGEENFTGTWTARVDAMTPFPEGTAAALFTQTAGAVELNCDTERTVTAEPVPLAAKWAAVPGKLLLGTSGQEYYVGLIPRGGNVEVPITREGAGSLRHKAGSELVDNPAPSGASEGGEGEDGGLAMIQFGVSEIDCLL